MTASQDIGIVAGHQYRVRGYARPGFYYRRIGQTNGVYRIRRLVESPDWSDAIHIIDLGVQVSWEWMALGLWVEFDKVMQLGDSTEIKLAVGTAKISMGTHPAFNGEMHPGEFIDFDDISIVPKEAQ